VTTEVLRYAAFTVDGCGGNPAGVVLDARGLDAADMQAIAADVGYSETAFLVGRPDEPNGHDVRYFSPKREVPFCGHATIASAVALAELSPAAELVFYTPAGVVRMQVSRSSRARTWGCPSEIDVSVIGGEPGVRVSGTAHRIDG